MFSIVIFCINIIFMIIIVKNDVFNFGFLINYNFFVGICNDILIELLG